MKLTPADVAKFCDQEHDDTFALLVAEHLPVVEAFVKAYTRGNGFTTDGYADDIGAVILTCTARLSSNPMQNKREEIGDYSVTPTPFVGFSLAESYVLNQYRRRTA
ncbi:hypothetical protein [Mariniluteicoccus flavus]